MEQSDVALSLTPLIVSATAIVMTAIIAVALLRFFNNRENARLRERIGILSLPVQQMSAAFQVALVRQLTHFHTPKLDALLAKLGPPFALTDVEMQELIAELKAREEDMAGQIDGGEREAAKMLPAIMRRVALEKAQPMEMFDLILVAVPKASDAIDKTFR
jgi:hypothetical protein